MTFRRHMRLRRSIALGFVLLSSLHSGCEAIPIHPAHDAYYRHDHMWCGNYAIDFEGARVAALTALTGLKMPVYQEGPLWHGVFIDTRTPENCEARVIIMPLGSHGEGTRIGVRVGGFGTHREVCKRLLDEIARCLDAGRDVVGGPFAPVPLQPVAPPASITP
jgi:hypothetical protein